MELEFDVNIKPNDLYDYMMYHTYTGMSGIVGTVCGFFMIILFFTGHQFLYLAGGIIILAYLPVSLFMRSRKQYLATPAFKESLHYLMNDEGVTISQGETKESQSWDDMVKAVSTPESIVLYTSRVKASIFPKKQLGDKKAALIQMISTHMDPKRVKIRGN
ncbi:MAG: YcxB family protein [Lachnospiraceae bacterium]|nr:YcxB family protein [Lachnospiraceae bacterium]